ncbi:hypothetical protein [Pararhodonellum marinum]|uniref:hypothetical protein n=1 Tax=Pararhodonellum marinum TaxID=2755358 RepID=UPI00188FBDE8|nr:hypothetical protein [Pararhodonellum marinum]
MKKLLAFPLLLMVFIFDLNAQNIEITPFTGYNFASGFNISGGRARLGDGQTFGGMLAFVASEYMEVELMYSFQRSTATANSTLLNENISEPTQVHLALIGVNRLFPVSEETVLFSGIKLGTGTLASPFNNFTNITRFTVGFHGGVKYFVSDSFGLRLQANLMIPITNVGANLWWSPGGGTQVGMSGWSPLAIFGFTGAAIIRVSK